MRVSIFAAMLAVFLALAAFANAVAIVGDNNAFLSRHGTYENADPIGVNLDLSVNLGTIPVAIPQNSYIQFKLKYAMELNYENTTVVKDQHDTIYEEVGLDGDTVTVVVGSMPTNTAFHFTFSNIRVSQATTSSWAIVRLFSPNDVELASGSLLFYPVGVQVFGQSRAAVVPLNTTAGSAFGRITVTLSPITVTIPNGGAIEFSIPASWTLADTFTCKASVNIASSSAANIDLTPAVVSPTNILVRFPSAIVKDASNILRIFCFNAVKVASVPETYTEYAQIIAYDGSNESVEIMEALRVPFPDITATPVAKPVVSQFLKLGRGKFSDAELPGYLAAFAAAVGLDVESLAVRSQFEMSTSLSKKKISHSLLDRHFNAHTLATTVRVGNEIQVPDGMTASSLVGDLNSRSAAIGNSLAASLGVDVVMEPASAGTEDLSCSNGVKDNAETDIDCGGATCNTCALTKTCLVNTDCASGICHPKSKRCSTSVSSASASSISGFAVAVLVMVIAVLF